MRNVNVVQFQEFINKIRPRLSDVHVRREFYRLIAYNRDIADGKGERKVTYMLLEALIIEGYGSEVIDMLKLFASAGFGYWGDLIHFYQLLETNKSTASDDVKRSIINAFVYQIRNDERLVIQYKNKLKTNPLDDNIKAPSLSLAAKWIPSEGSKYDLVAFDLTKVMFPFKYDEGGIVMKSSVTKSLTRYRQLVVELRRHLDLVETKMSANRWGEIEPSATPAKTMKKHRKVFMNKKGSVDAGRVLLAEKLNLLLSGKTDKTIKTKGLQFYELIKPYVDGGCFDDVLEVQAKTIIKEMQGLVKDGNFPLSVALCDVSGSMSGVPMIVSIALGILLANVMPAPWNGRVITFESRPRWVDLNTRSSIYDQVRVLKDAPWGGSTNFTAAVDLVLQQALASKNPKESIPEFFFCFTDMQFDQASERGTFVIDEVKRKFQDNGLVMPKLILWNLRASGTNTFAADKDTKDVGILSGFSQSVFNAFMSGCNFELMTPMYLLKEALHVARYDVIANCAK